MSVVIGVIEKSKFKITNYVSFIQNSFTEILHRNTLYMYVLTFEQHTTGYPFDHVFNSNEDYEAWLFYVPPMISKLQAVSLLLQTERYADLMTALEADATVAKKILFDAAHQLYRDSTMVNEMAVALNFTSEETDTFFVDADKILV